MEALASIALAGNILQFAEFGVKVVSIAKEVYKSSTGSLPEHQELEVIVRDLEQHFSSFNSGVDTCGDPLILKLLETCKTLASELSLILQRVKPPNTQHNLVGSVRGSIRVLRSKGEIKDLERRLDRVRAEICARLLVLLL